METARFRAPGGVFRYLLVDVVDVFGHRLHYDYRNYGVVPLVDRIGYVFTDGSTPRYTVTFDYERRPDKLSDARSGTNELLEHRLAGVDVYSGDNRLRHYALTYEDDARSGGFSRLARVETLGNQGGVNPIAYGFEYSRALGGACAGDDCAAPVLVELGALGVGIASRRATLADLNGDALPDIVDASEVDAPHRIYLARLEADGRHVFAGPVDSAVGRSSGHPIDSPQVQEMDFNGDGLADLLNARTGEVLVNRGTGDWAEAASVGAGGVAELPDFAEDFEPGEDSELPHVRFFDYDGDRRIDVIRSRADTTEIFRALGDGGFARVDDVQVIGRGFAEDRLDLADMNGDGLLDPVVLGPDQLSYRINLGFGRWSDWLDVRNVALTQADRDFAHLEDINGDGLTDLVVVLGNEVRYALNRNGAELDAPQALDSAGGEGLPETDASTTVLFADMNGNGSDDVVWIDPQGAVTYLEIFPVRPNLLARITNGLGLTVDVAYGTSVQHRARTPAAWPHSMPMSMLVVDRIDTFAATPRPEDAVHEVTAYTYAAGFYDGDEKQFRGFADVARVLEGDESQAAGTTTDVYDVGHTDVYRAGRLLEQAFTDEAGPLRLDRYTYEDCPLTGVPMGLTPPVRYVCQTASESVQQEGAPEAQWATVRTERTYDGYGNLASLAELGVTAIGGGACPACTRDAGAYGAPCGAQCTGDERYTETEYAPPGARWMLGRPTVERISALPGAENGAETRTYYDGDAFVGLPEGQIDLGLETRVTRRFGSGAADVVEIARNRYDGDGNLVENLSPTAVLGADDGQTLLTWDADHLRIVGEDLGIGGDTPYRLRRDFEYEPLFDRVSRATDWYVGDAADAPVSQYLYDEFARVRAIVRPGGDTAAEPTEEYVYELASPVSRVVVRRRSEAGGDADLESALCLDGFGRRFQERDLVADGRWLVSAHRVFNRRGEPRRIYQPYESNTGECGTAGAGAFVQLSFDSLGRERRVEQPDGDLYPGGPSASETRYIPLATVGYDEEDLDGPNADTPATMWLDGLGRVVGASRLETPGGMPLTHTFTYDERGNLRGFSDPMGNEKRQTYDWMGRVVEVDDPDAGKSDYEYDAGSNVIRYGDPRGIVVQRAYDGHGRLTAEWDEADADATRITTYYDRHPSCPECTNTAGRIAGGDYPLGELGSGGEALGYDVRGNPAYVRRRIGDKDFEFRSAFDNADRLLEQSFPGGRTLAFTYDGADRLISVPGYISDLTYDERGLPAGTRYLNGVDVTRGFDSRMRLASVRATGPDDPMLLSLDVRRNRIDDVVEVVDGRPAGAPARLDAKYTHDALRRLVRAELSKGDDAETLSFVYDRLDNPTSMTSDLTASAAHVGALTYDLPGRPRAVTSAAGVDYEYDEAGNVVGRGADELERDFKGRLTAVRRGPEERARSYYGASNERLVHIEGSEVVWTIAANFEVRDGVSRIAVIVDDARLVEIDAADLATELRTDLDDDDAITAADAWLAQSDDEASPVRHLLRTSARTMLLDEQETTASFLVADHLGSTVAVTDAAGAVTERFAYHPYGNLREASAGDDERAAFTGKGYDRSGLLYFGARYYDPEVGRFTSADPEFRVTDSEAFGRLTDATATFGFVGNNPTTMVDPDGEFAFVPGIGNIVGAAVGFAVRLGAEIAVQRASGEGFSKKTVAKIFARSLFSAVKGFFSFGASAIGDGVKGYAKYRAIKNSTDEKGAVKRIGRIGAGVSLAVTAGTYVLGALVDPVGTALQMSADVGELAVKAAGSLVVTAIGYAAETRTEIGGDARVNRAVRKNWAAARRASAARKGSAPRPPRTPRAAPAR